jgi:hypothetical protein
VDKIDRLGKGDDFAITQKEIVNSKTGSRILFRGIKTSSGNQTAKLKSIQGVTTWVLDEAEELVDRRTFDTIDDSIRSQLQPNRVILSLNPSSVDHFLHELFVASRRADTLYLHTTWEDNRENLSDSFLAKIEQTRTDNPARYAHVYGGQWRREVSGLLWTRAEIERARIVSRPDDLARVLVAIDPAVTANESSDETGIVVVGVDRHRKGYVLEDLSGRYSPNEWATVALDEKTRVWTDLQLPLYERVLAAEFGNGVACGYFNLPKAVGDSGIVLWDDFSVELRESAGRCAEGVTAAIRAGEFWPPREFAGQDAERDEFAALFHHGAAASVAWAEAGP